MISNRELTEFAWRVFQHGHFGWWFTNANSRICARAYPSQRAAMDAMLEAKKTYGEGWDMTKRQPPLAEAYKGKDPVMLAALQGFDDGYFRNKRRELKTEAEQAAYEREFAIGSKQRMEAAR
jgi:hypothetical protein